MMSSKAASYSSVPTYSRDSISRDDRSVTCIEKVNLSPEICDGSVSVDFQFVDAAKWDISKNETDVEECSATEDDCMHMVEGRNKSNPWLSKAEVVTIVEKKKTQSSCKSALLWTLAGVVLFVILISAGVISVLITTGLVCGHGNLLRFISGKIGRKDGGEEVTVSENDDSGVDDDNKNDDHSLYVDHNDDIHNGDNKQDTLVDDRKTSSNSGDQKSNDKGAQQKSGTASTTTASTTTTTTASTTNSSSTVVTIISSSSSKPTGSLTPVKKATTTASTTTVSTTNATASTTTTTTAARISSSSSSKTPVTPVKTPVTHVKTCKCDNGMCQKDDMEICSSCNQEYTLNESTNSCDMSEKIATSLQLKPNPTEDEKTSLTKYLIEWSVVYLMLISLR